MDYQYSFQDIQLSEEQTFFVNRALQGGNILVDACIGSGKTTSIQALCNMYPVEKRILYLTYNRLLKVDARSKITNKNVVVTNYHGFAYSTLRKNGISVGIPELINAFNSNDILIQSFDVLIIDEYQDITTEISIMLEKIKNNNPQIQIIAVGDTSQKIYGNSTLDVTKFINKFLAPYSTLSFTKCFRLCKQHAELLGRIWKKKIIGSNDSCTVEEMSYEQILQVLSETDPKDILCLGSRNGQMTDALNYLEKTLPNIFNKYTVYASIRDSDAYKTVDPSNNSAIFTTFDSSKGLERNVCIVFDWTEKYWESRKGFESYEILRNIFCVAASRGKKRIIFLNEYGTISEKTLSTSYQLTQGTQNVKYDISSMFDFKYQEDIEECFSLLKTSLIEVADKSVIDINTKDGLIDISPCIGIYQEAFFFTKYDIDVLAKHYEQIIQISNPNYRLPESFNLDSLEKKILFLTSLDTKQKRYYTQVDCPYITKKESELLFKRLSSEFRQDEEIQKECSISFAGANEGHQINVIGLCDVIKNNTVYELKYISDLTHVHFLQCACYIIALDLDLGILWNTKNNTKYEIRIPDKQAFLNAVVKTITKGKVAGLNNHIAVIDTETSFSNNIISIGCVVADESSYDITDSVYYIIEPACHEPAMFSDKLIVDGVKAQVLSRTTAITKLIQFLNKHYIKKIFAYNATFDFNHLRELKQYSWFDIMKIARCAQYNKSIKIEECNGSGRLKKGYGVEAITRRLLKNDKYQEVHNALLDAVDELRIMKLLNCPASTYDNAIIYKPICTSIHCIKCGKNGDPAEFATTETNATGICNRCVLDGKLTKNEIRLLKYCPKCHTAIIKKHGKLTCIAFVKCGWKSTIDDLLKDKTDTISILKCRICGKEGIPEVFSTKPNERFCICNDCVLNRRIALHQIGLLNYCPKCHKALTRERNTLNCNSVNCGWTATTDTLIKKKTNNSSQLEIVFSADTDKRRTNNTGDFIKDKPNKKSVSKGTSIKDLENRIVNDGKYVSFLKRQYFIPKDSDWIVVSNLAHLKRIPILEYQYTLAGCPFSPELKAYDDEIISFLEKHKVEGDKICLSNKADYEWINSLADSNDMSVKELVELFGFHYDDRNSKLKTM